MTVGTVASTLDRSTYAEWLDVNGARIVDDTETFELIPHEWTVKRIWVEQDKTLGFGVLCILVDGDFTDLI